MGLQEKCLECNSPQLIPPFSILLSTIMYLGSFWAITKKYLKVYGSFNLIIGSIRKVLWYWIFIFSSVYYFEMIRSLFISVSISYCKTSDVFEKYSNVLPKTYFGDWLLSQNFLSSFLSNTNWRYNPWNFEMKKNITKCKITGVFAPDLLGNNAKTKPLKC